MEKRKQKSTDHSMPKSLMLEDIDLIANNYKSLKDYPHNLWKNFIQFSSDESIEKYKNIVLNNN